MSDAHAFLSHHGLELKLPDRIEAQLRKGGCPALQKGCPCQIVPALGSYVSETRKCRTDIFYSTGIAIGQLDMTYVAYLRLHFTYEAKRATIVNTLLWASVKSLIILILHVAAIHKIATNLYFRSPITLI